MAMMARNLQTSLANRKTRMSSSRLCNWDRRIRTYFMVHKHECWLNDIYQGGVYM